jgi:nucleoside 2-deoxyribosyltransferase
MADRRWYLAGPFFNERQLLQMANLEMIAQDHDEAFFSPRWQHPAGIPQPVTTAERATELFRTNVAELVRCTHVLATLDYLLPEGHALSLLRAGQAAKPVSLPDAGTIWELGFATALGRPVVLFTERVAFEEPKVNLMLAVSALGVVYGFRHWDDFLGNRQPLESWKGGLL